VRWVRWVRWGGLTEKGVTDFGVFGVWECWVGGVEWHWTEARVGVRVLRRSGRGRKWGEVWEGWGWGDAVGSNGRGWRFGFGNRRLSNNTPTTVENRRVIDVGWMWGWGLRLEGGNHGDIGKHAWIAQLLSKLEIQVSNPHLNSWCYRSATVLRFSPTVQGSMCY